MTRTHPHNLEVKCMVLRTRLAGLNPSTAAYCLCDFCQVVSSLYAWISSLVKWWQGFLGGSVVKNLPTMQETQKLRFNPWVGKIPWRRNWQPTPEFLPGKSHGQRSPVGHSPWGHKSFGCNWATKNNNKIVTIIVISSEGFVVKVKWMNAFPWPLNLVP